MTVTETAFGPLNRKDLQLVDVYREAANGSRIARDRLKYEVLSTSDFANTFAKVNTIAIRDAIAELPSTWDKVAKVAVVDNFKPTKEVRFEFDTDLNVPPQSGGYPNVPGTLSRVPEGTEYPTIGFTRSGKAFGVSKSGIRLKWTFEAFIDDEWDEILAFPNEAAAMARFTEEIEVWRQFFGGNGFNANMFKAAGNLTGNPALTFTSLSAALVQATQPPATGLNNRPLINTLNKWALVVPQGSERFARSLLNSVKVVVTDTDGTQREVPVEFAADVEVVGVPYMPTIVAAVGGTPAYATTFWALVPFGGENQYGTVANLAKLRGNEEPELRIKYDQGKSLSGGDIGQYAGSFEDDTTQTRLRYIIQGNTLGNVQGIVWSKGTGVSGNTP